MSVATSESSSASTRDEELFTAALSILKDRGFIEYDGEFGPEITTFVPFVAWLKQEGHLQGRRVITFGGMRPYYFFLADEEFETKPQRRIYRNETKRKWPTNTTHSATKQEWHRCPDYRAYYRDRGRAFDRPVLFIQNKFAVEWNAGPINYLPLFAIEQLFRISAGRFDVVYSRPREVLDGKGYARDHNRGCEYPDIEIAERYNVPILEEMCLETGADYNTTKLEILAKSHLFVAAQGGGAHVLACFSNSLLLVLHREGREYPHAYAAGPYKYLSDPPPLLLVARDNDQLLQGLKVVAATTMEGGAPVIADHAMPFVETLRL